MFTADDEAQCMAALDRWMDALNAHDADAMEREMRFPHARLAKRRLAIYDKPGSNPMDLFARLAKESGWAYSRWDSREVLHTLPGTAHIAVIYTRYRADGSVIGQYD
ncbi:MAG: hypothetical protein JSS20_07610, partial [Proteobacteria bacterium]|nr:hypothetical protein [Pseudomonadota bacterium]